MESDRVICENDSFIAIYDGFPVNPGHTLVIPKKHVKLITDIDVESVGYMHSIILNVIDILKKKFNPDGFNIGVNCGEAAGQTVNHAHIHIIPRYKGDVENPRGGVRGVIPNKKEY